MSNAFEAPLRLELRPSRRLRRWLLAVHGAVAIVVPLLPPWLGLAVLSAGGASAALAWRALARRPPLLLWHGDGRWELASDGGDTAAVLARPPFVHPQLVVLPLRSAHGGPIRPVVVLPDMLDITAFRRLRVRLCMARTVPAGDGGSERVACRPRPRSGAR